MRLMWKKLFLLIYLFIFSIISYFHLAYRTHTQIDNRNWVKNEEFAIFPEDGQKTDRILEQLRFVPSRLSDRPVVIFVPHQSAGVSVREFDANNCTVRNCIFTFNKEDSSTADVVFFTQFLQSETFVRPPGQLWVLQMLESPEYSPNLGIDFFVNYTATYRWDSDLVTPYERWTHWEMVPLDQRNGVSIVGNKRNYAKGKSKLVSMFVSHCFTSNKRLQYAKRLGSYIKVDIFGTCADLRCNRNDQKCWKMLDTDYKFYLSFENGNCRDYVTEKYFVNGLQ